MSRIIKWLTSSKFSFRIYLAFALLSTASVGLLNWLVDPLWYNQGNRLTGKNFAFNERISKTNLFLRVKHEHNCLIFGSSRTIALRASFFKGDRCFNYSIKGGWIDELTEYAKFAKASGMNPTTIYVGVDEFNFVERVKTDKLNLNPGELYTTSKFDAYFSLNVLLFSLLTLAEISPDKANYYNREFEIEEFSDPPRYTANFHKAQEPQRCDLSWVDSYREIRTAFPDSVIVGYVPPRATWAVINETYSRNIMDCALQGFHAVSNIYDAMYDFSVPSKLTQTPDNTYDGSHFTPEANAQVAAVLEGQTSDIAVRVDHYSLEDYRSLYKQQLRKFLKAQNQEALWHN